MLQCNRQGLCHLCHCHLANWHIDIHLLFKTKGYISRFISKVKTCPFSFYKIGWLSHPAWVIKLQMIFRWSLSNPHPCRYIAHWRLKGMTSPKNTYSFGHLHCFNSTMYAYCLLGRPKNDRPSSQKLWPNLIFGLIGPLKLQCKTSNWWPEPIYGSIMLKTCVCHFLTKLHPFFTYEGGKKIGPNA